jgi:putative transposase
MYTFGQIPSKIGIIYWQMIIIRKIIIEQLQWLKKEEKVRIYGYVIMPNHLHILWEMLERNGMEMPHASFNKWTSSNFLKKIRKKS